MLKLVMCIRRKPTLSRAEFQRYWREHHAELVRSVARHIGALRYVQSHTIDSPFAEKANAARNSEVPVFDGITEFWWPDENAMRPEGSSVEDLIQTQKKLVADEREFIDVSQSVVFYTEEHEIYNDES